MSLFRERLVFRKPGQHVYRLFREFCVCTKEDSSQGLRNSFGDLIGLDDSLADECFSDRTKGIWNATIHLPEWLNLHVYAEAY